MCGLRECMNRMGASHRLTKTLTNVTGAVVFIKFHVSTKFQIFVSTCPRFEPWNVGIIARAYDH
jgi:hypothetical protein